MVSIADCKMNFYELPLARLHVLEAGDGPPLIIVPATISECKDWIPLTRFMAHWFHVYFFELPGHGESTPFREPFSTDLVAETVEQLLDTLHVERFSVMGFSFGGILAMKTFRRLSSRVDNVILISPCLTRRAVQLPRLQVRAALGVVRFINRPRVRRIFLRFLHSPRTVTPVFNLLRFIGSIESTIELRPKLLTISESTLEVLGCQVGEIVTVEFPVPAEKHKTPCYLWMSVNDPVLDFETTLAAAQAHFAGVEVVRSEIPYHQPPEPLTYDGLIRDYFETVGNFLQKPRCAVTDRETLA
jgi:pimeloyl-ACP methyl ester carboxylesterase